MDPEALHRVLEDRVWNVLTVFHLANLLPRARSTSAGPRSPPCMVCNPIAWPIGCSVGHPRFRRAPLGRGPLAPRARRPEQRVGTPSQPLPAGSVETDSA